MKRAVFFSVLAITGASLWAIVAFEHGFAHFLGIDTQASQNYDFVSGVGPMFIAALGYVAMVSALIGKFNCHQRGCWRIGKHHINGSPWCDRHHENVRPQMSERELLEMLLTELRTLTARVNEPE